jgi:endonuclease-3
VRCLARALAKREFRRGFNSKGAMAARRERRLASLISRLRTRAGRIVLPPVADPYRLLLWEQVAYLADDTTRLAAFRELESEIGTAPQAIVGAPLSALKAIARSGGAVGADLRAKRLRFVAERVLQRWDGDLWPVVKLPYEDAVRELMRYPAIGRPGAEKILLLAKAYKPLALESNGLRVLLRLGYGRDLRRYDKTYAAVQAAAQAEIASTVRARISAHYVLRAHGQTLCKRTAPLCSRCPVRDECFELKGARM